MPLQKNSKDCACFTIYFGKCFLSNPESTLALIKVFGTVSQSCYLLKQDGRGLSYRSRTECRPGGWKTLTWRSSVAKLEVFFLNTFIWVMQWSNTSDCFLCTQSIFKFLEWNRRNAANLTARQMICHVRTRLANGGRLFIRIMIFECSHNVILFQTKKNQG